MSFDPSQPSPESPNPNDSTPPVRARVPDHVADGCFSSGAIVMTGPSEFIVDFLQTIGRPHRVAKRVIVPHAVMPQFVDALQTNLQLYKNRFGDPPQPPAPNPPPERRPTPQEIYDDLKLPDDVLSGVYANGVMIGHGASEFGLDFMTSFFPQSAVSARIFLSAGQIPRLLESLRGAVQQLQQRQQAIQGSGPIQVSAGGPQLQVQPTPPATSQPNLTAEDSGKSSQQENHGESDAAASSDTQNPATPPLSDSENQQDPPNEINPRDSNQLEFNDPKSQQDSSESDSGDSDSGDSDSGAEGKSKQ
jgi:hypothetical protein